MGIRRVDSFLVKAGEDVHIDEEQQAGLKSGGHALAVPVDSPF